MEFEEFYPEPLNAWYEVRAYPSPEGLSVFFRDITERRRIEEALRQSEARYRSLFNAMDQGFALFDVVNDESGAPREARFVDVNPAFESMIGLTRDDVVGRRGRDVFPDEYAKWANVYGRVVQSGEPTAFQHARSGSERLYEVFAFRPAPGQFAVLFHDVTEQKRLEEELRVNLTKYRVLFESFPLGISVTDSAGERPGSQSGCLTRARVPGEQVVGQRIGRPEWRIIRPDGSLMPPEEFASVRASQEQSSRGRRGVGHRAPRRGCDLGQRQCGADPARRIWGRHHLRRHYPAQAGRGEARGGPPGGRRRHRTARGHHGGPARRARHR